MEIQGSPDDNPMDDERLPADCFQCSITKAVRGVGRQRLDALARKIVFVLQRSKASNIYGDDYNFNTLWDEYCLEIHQGPTPIVSAMWDMTLEPYLARLADNLSADEGLLLSVAAAWEFCDYHPDNNPGYDPALIRRGIRSRLDEIADRRSLDRLLNH
jgi:hypothetical protein